METLTFLRADKYDETLNSRGRRGRKKRKKEGGGSEIGKTISSIDRQTLSKRRGLGKRKRRGGGSGEKWKSLKKKDY